MLNTAYLLLGANLGKREKSLQMAIREIEKHVGNIKLASSIYETEPWGEKKQLPYLNQAILVKSTLSPQSILEEILKAEQRLGRKHRRKWASREIDIDILFYNNEVIEEPKLQIPHPHIKDRRFTLVPMVEIAGSLVHPTLKHSMKELLEQCPDIAKVAKHAEAIEERN